MQPVKNTQVSLVCIRCKSSFKVKAYRTETAKYCSRPCWSVRNPPEPRSCAYCGVIFNSRDKRSRFCSRRCATKPRVGPLAGAWKGGKSLARKRARAGGELTKWRKEVFRRDRFTCRRCGASRVKLHAHHVLPFASYPEKMFDVDNGLTLCIPCHEAEHGRKISTPATHPKKCSHCSARTTGRSAFCMSCAIARSWTARRSSINQLRLFTS